MVNLRFGNVGTFIISCYHNPNAGTKRNRPFGPLLYPDLHHQGRLGPPDLIALGHRPDGRFNV